ncbi:unnamed protein product [Rotaria sp. Silwood1]|nr:unnamed protein product [Rotaria sp. Silwood1]CAF1572147.1 unnamed protein product [Rotaria sp. Silwood1]CAF1574144.1 unnamed protein product [Rotaria sp. Silwood1]CAF3657799.1 unnamed protein product [Rotaria sp. Silwood1]CAF3672124.1 unnamed protein product [Rotaria sp. Silwood1]
MQELKTSKHHHNHHRHHHHHHRSKRSSPAPIIDDSNDQYLDRNGYHQTSISTSLPLLSEVQCSAYFIHRLDLDSYAIYTLRQTVDRIVSGPKSKGLKVKLSLPDEGLVIDNVPDPNQSWMYKTSELLFFWHDPLYLSIIIVITINPSHYRTNGPYSASIFRLRGNESAQLFIQRAQQFFAHLSTVPITKSDSKNSDRQEPTIENWTTDNDKKHRRKRSKHHSVTKKRSDVEFPQSIRASPVCTASRTEFEPEKTKKLNSSLNQYNYRTFSETTIFSDAPTMNSMKLNNHNNGDNNITSSNNNLSDGLVAELMRELKELRSEIAELKLEARFTPVHIPSTSPSFVFPDDIKGSLHSSPSSTKYRLHSDIDAETQTDFSLINNKQQQLLEKNESTINGLNQVSVTYHKKKDRSHKTVNRYNPSNNNESDREVNFSSTNGSFNGITSSSVQEEYRSKTIDIKPHDLLRPSENGLIHMNNSTSSRTFDKSQPISNSSEEDLTLKMTPLTIEKELQKSFSTKVSSILNDTKSSLSKKHEDIVSFHSNLEDTVTLPQHYYENVPISINTDSNQGSFINRNNQQEKPSQIYVNIVDDSNLEFQKKYLTHLYGSQNGSSLLLSQQPISYNSSSSSFSEENTSASIIQETISNNYQYGQPIVFANHLTNPLFNIDKDLLANTIANQFGVDHNSPYLPQLIANQHLFVSDKRTFANMVWHITPEEENALCSSPLTMTSNNFIKNTNDSNNLIAKSILKSNKLSRSLSKKQRITWDSTLE